jgi:DNA-binding response OmpR family regulator
MVITGSTRLTPRDGQAALVLLDLTAPHSDGISLLPIIRKLTQAPIIIVGAKSTSAGKVVGTPFDLRQLASVLISALRRQENGGETSEYLTFHDLIINVKHRTVERANTPIRLTPREFEVLATLVGEPGYVFSRETLIERLWSGRVVTLGVVDTYVSFLRAKVDLPFDEPLIHNVRGSGYCVRAGSTARA